jgi:hypothetical protein
MSTPSLPTIWELVAEASHALPEPFSRAQLISWISARRPDVAVTSIAHHVQFATANAGHSAAHPFAGRTPLLHRVERGRYRRYRPERDPDAVRTSPGVVTGVHVVLVGSSGATAGSARPAGALFTSSGFARARDAAVASGRPWFVLSARHGLLDPDDVVGPFDDLIGDRPAGYRAAWAEWVVARLADRVRLPGAVVEVHGGVDFAQPLRGPLTRRGAHLEVPLPWDGADVPDAGWHDDRPAVPAVLDRLRGLVGRRP